MAFGLSAGAVSLIGGGLGLLAGGDSEQSQTNTKEPWKEAAPWLKGNIRTGQSLQNYYQQNPFNQQQQTGYQNLFGDLDSFRNQMAPGLMDFANQLMGTNYQRGQGNNRQGGMQQPMRQGNGMMNLGGQQQPMRQGGLMNAAGMQQPSLLNNTFAAPQGHSYGQVDWAAQNPFTNGSIDTAAAAPDARTVQELVAAELERQKREQANMNGEQYGGF